MKFKQIRGHRILYKPTHLAYPSEAVYDSWMTLCEHTIELAEKHLRDEFEKSLDRYIEKLSDEMLATAEEVEEPKKK